MNITKLLRRTIFSLLAILLANTCFAGSWAPIRTSGSGKAGWQPLVCENGKGWMSCEMPVNIALVAAPTTLVASGQTATITATVTDYYGVPIEGSTLNWTTTDGVISAPKTITNDKGITSITLTSSHTLGGATVTAESQEKDGKTSIFVPFIDQWVAYPSTYTAWANYGSVYSCTAWSPDPSTIAAGTWFTQWANCWQTQIQYRQDREQSVVSGAVRNSGAPVALFQAIVVSISQASVGTLQTGPVCVYAPGSSYIGYKTSCRGGGEGNPRSGVYYNGIDLPRAGNINGISAGIYNGLIYYAGPEMGRQGISCSGSEGAVIYYQICHD